MDLESILAGVKNIKKYSWDIADNFAQRNYARFVQAWEHFGFNKLTLAGGLLISGIESINLSLPAPKEIGNVDFYNRINVIDHLAAGVDTINTIVEGLKLHAKTKYQTSDAQVEDEAYILSFLAKGLRLPLLVIGLGFGYCGASEVKDFIGNNDWVSMHHGMFYLLLGYGNFAIASSIYIKDSDPKILKKDPLWKESFEKLGQWMFSVPETSPVKVRSNYKDQQPQLL